MNGKEKPFGGLLVTNGDKESQEAKKILSDNQVRFNEMHFASFYAENEPYPPTFITGEGDFSGIDKIREYIEIVANRPDLG